MSLLDSLLSLLYRSYDRLLELPGWLLDGGKRFFWLYLVSFVILGLVAYWMHYRRSEVSDGPRGLWRFLFPREVYTHPSAMIDYQLFLANRILGPSGFLSRALLGSFTIAYVASATQGALLHAVDGVHEPVPWTWPTLLAFTVCIALVRDFSTYVTHGLHHRIPLLWQFHKVHHSAEVLTPVTLYRKHPVYGVLSRLTDMLIVAPFQGLVAFLFAGRADSITLFGTNFVITLFLLMGSNLRHSHIWFSFGWRLSHVFISPAQHQIHHSKAKQHWNKNYGQVFALWDWLFGTLYVPREREALEFGVGGDAPQEHSTLLRAYWVPFVGSAQLLRGYLVRLLAFAGGEPPRSGRRSR